VRTVKVVWRLTHPWPKVNKKRVIDIDRDKISEA